MSGKGKKVWNFIENFAGDKVVLIIVLMLILFSIVCIFSSSSRLITANTDRIDIVKDHLFIVALGLAFIFICYQIRSIEFFRKVSSLGFFVAFGFLFLLVIGGVGNFITAPEINGAVRFLKVKGIQVHVFEIAKVAMIMYIAWAVDALKRDNFKLLDKLSELDHMHWVKNRLTKKIIFLYLPAIIVMLMVMKGSNTAALMIGLVMILTIAIGTGEIKEIFIAGAAAVMLFVAAFGMYSITKNSEHVMFQRIGLFATRLGHHNYVKEYHEAANDLAARQKALDKLRQPYSAKIAIQQGGFIGKGPGQSTQRYVVPDMSEDYMFSFILEEYGWLGGMAVMILYISLIARGVLIVKNCGTNLFAKCAVMGLVLLISGQAMIHIIVNADVGLLTGQTLPLLSHGASAFICFCIAFGIILSISRISNRKIETETKKATPLIDLHDTVEASLADLDSFDSGEYDTIEETDENEDFYDTI
ncbi:MAG: FtsW/RodA/SpoVE family cell cycle protein [Bacteroidales bacterium]|nr:FtsW/RodA/SpoVE family cell cycle protein [Bacteroidales bacterium]